MKIRRPSHATVVAYLALFAALGGSAYAASKVGTSELKPNAVTEPKIAKNAVHAGEVKQPIVRVARKEVAAGDPNDSFVVEARCKKKERLISGGGGWDTSGGVIVSSGPESDDVPPAPVADYTVFGIATTKPNALEARAVCLPK